MLRRLRCRLVRRLLRGEAGSRSSEFAFDAERVKVGNEPAQLTCGNGRVGVSAPAT